MKILLSVILLTLTGCNSALSILDGATHACGEVHVEGYFTDSQGDVIIVKAPSDWTPEQVKELCAND